MSRLSAQGCVDFKWIEAQNESGCSLLFVWSMKATQKTAAPLANWSNLSFESLNKVFRFEIDVKERTLQLG